LNITLNACVFIYEKKREEEKKFNREKNDSDQSDCKKMENKKEAISMVVFVM
jgi:hypothetical protein